MRLFSCKVAHPAVTHRGFSIINALRRVGSLEIHRKDRGEVALVQLDDELDELAESSYETVEEAMQSARMDFGVETEEWERAS